MIDIRGRLKLSLLGIALMASPGLAAAQETKPSPAITRSDSATSPAESSDPITPGKSEGETEKPQASKSSATIPRQGDDLAPYNPLDTYSFFLTAMFIGFGLLVILLQLAAMRRITTITADEIARNCAITLVVVASVALLVSGYSSQQVAPAFGLFGTIIGYLLGKAGAKTDANGEKKV
ncbi:hypothetical protein BH10PSE3_BH10PSE3_42280 [soil metagenome]|jgi:hypothetical protein